MRSTSRLIAGACLLACVACAHRTAVAPPEQPHLTVPFPTGTTAQPPTGASPMFMMRVSKSLGATAEQPLYVLNGGMLPGVPYLRPDDIARVEVVTGDDAVARYGTQRNVVVITTRWYQARSRS